MLSNRKHPFLFLLYWSLSCLPMFRVDNFVNKYPEWLIFLWPHSSPHYIQTAFLWFYVLTPSFMSFSYVEIYGPLFSFYLPHPYSFHCPLPFCLSIWWFFTFPYIQPSSCGPSCPAVVPVPAPRFPWMASRSVRLLLCPWCSLELVSGWPSTFESGKHPWRSWKVCLTLNPSIA